LSRRILICLLPALALLTLAACGREAPPRAATVAPTTTTRHQPTSAPAPAQDAATAPEQRALGDPNAPIIVIEYGDYQ
jgi:hypothetical protein